VPRRMSPNGTINRVDEQDAVWYLWGVNPPVPLPEGQRATLEAVIRRLVPHAFGDAARGRRLLAAVRTRAEGLAPHLRERFGRALLLLGSPVAALLVVQRPRRFVRQPAAAQDRLLAAWARSRVPALRAAVHGVRRFVMQAEYATPEALEEVGYRGPYHTRGPAVAWEGALPGTRSDAEPVLRAPDPAAAHRPRALPATLSPLAIDGQVLRAGVVVIGTGMGGAVAAARLAEAGFDVLMVEAGDLVTGEELDEQEAPMFARLYADEGLRTTDDAGVALFQGAALGGGTTVNWMVMLRTPDHVLDEWAAYHGVEGMRAPDLAPIFDRIEQETHTRLVPEDAHSPNNRIILGGARALGWSAFAARINATGCVRTGFCGYGCRSGAKQGALQTYLPRAQRAGARLITHGRAERIEFAAHGGSFPTKRVIVRHAPPDGPAREITIESPVVVIAAGAIETPALLERSGMGGGGVGRYLRLHPTTGLYGFYEHEMYGAGGIPLSAACDEFLRLDSAGYGCLIECPPLHPGLAAASTPGFGRAHRETMLRFQDIGTLIVLVRDGARRGESDGEVRTRRDGSVSIRYRLSRPDAAHLEAGLVAAARLHFAAGAQEVLSGHSRPVVLHSADDVGRLRGRPMGANQIALASAHVNGTCRMGTDRRTAGTDTHGERFGAAGVFVADGSLLPTALGVNPQETIAALATIVAERIASRRRPG